METILKIHGVEMLRAEVDEAFLNDRKYLITGRNIYKLRFSISRNTFFTNPIYHKRGGVPLMNNGRFKLATAAEVNDLIKLLND